MKNLSCSEEIEGVLKVVSSLYKLETCLIKYKNESPEEIIRMCENKISKNFKLTITNCNLNKQQMKQIKNKLPFNVQIQVDKADAEDYFYLFD